jgi:hypothetical protein
MQPWQLHRQESAKAAAHVLRRLLESRQTHFKKSVLRAPQQTRRPGDRPNACLEGLRGARARLRTGEQLLQALKEGPREVQRGRRGRAIRRGRHGRDHARQALHDGLPRARLRRGRACPARQQGGMVSALGLWQVTKGFCRGGVCPAQQHGGMKGGGTLVAD